MASTVLPNGIIIPEKYSRDWYADLYHNWQELDNLLGGGGGGANDGTLTIQKNGATVGTFSANQATDETIDITVPDVNDATLTIQQNGTTVDTFTANSSTDKTVDITVPTKTSDLTNDSNFVQSSDLATVATSGSYNDLSNKPTIPTVNNATLTIQKNGTNVATFSANASTNATANITVPTKTSDLTNDSNFVESSDLATVATSGSYNDLSDTPNIPTVNNATLTIQQNGTTVDTFTANASVDKTININTADDTKIPLAGSNAISGSLIPATDNSIDVGSSSKNIKMLYTKGITIDGTQFLPSDYIPRSGGAVISGAWLGTTFNDNGLSIIGGTEWNNGGTIYLNGKDRSILAGAVCLRATNRVNAKEMQIYPSGTWTWEGTAVQLISDQRLKQQITEIDDALLDAWEDVNLVQFKYNDAVGEKGDTARLHTGYVVQQIDNACKSHGVDISQYGLYCHEEYPEETEEVEIEQADGTKTKETKVIREASEHYSLRYTEALIVECKYLRRCIARLTARIEELEKGNNTK